MKIFILIIFALMVSIIPFAYAQSISGTSHGNDISLKFSDDGVSGIITMKDHTINLSDVRVIERGDKSFIIDKQNDLKILAKKIALGKYIILVKINSEDIQKKMRFIADPVSENNNPSQRNLFDAMDQKRIENENKESITLTPAELRYQEKQKAIDAALKIRDERLAKMAEQESTISDDVVDPKTIIEEYRKLKENKGTGPGLLFEEEVEKVKVKPIVNHHKIKTFLSVPHHQEWKKELRYTVLVTDDIGRQYDVSYKEYVGNPMKYIPISGTIKNPTNNIIQSFVGTTDQSGEYLGKFLIPDQSTTRGEYVISIDAVKTFKDDATTTSSNSEIFYVFPRSSSPNINHAPIANAGPDQPNIDESFTNSTGIFPTIVTLDGSGSTDPDNDPITYLWTIIEDDGFDITLDDDTAQMPTFTAPDVDSPLEIIIELLVTDDRGKPSDTTDSVTITIIDVP